MTSNIEKYKKEVETLISEGMQLLGAMQYSVFPKETKNQFVKLLKGEDDAVLIINKLPNFTDKYQLWYSEALVLIKQLLPDRLADFIKFYERSKTRKEITPANYVIEDFLQGINITKGYYKEKAVGPEAAIPQFKQQLNILISVRKRFESSLFDIRQLVQADLFDSELDSARELIKHRFVRAAGAISGVVLEKHLYQIAVNHNLKSGKKNPTINDFNELLKNNNVIDTAKWRFIQHLGDIRNLCDHNKNREPTKDEVSDLISGVEKIIKTTF